MVPGELDKIMLRLKIGKAEIAAAAELNRDNFVRITNGAICGSTTANRISKAISKLDQRRISYMTINDRLFHFKLIEDGLTWPE